MGQEAWTRSPDRFSLSLEWGRSQSNFLRSCFLETLISCTNLTCMAISQSDSFVGQQQKRTQSSETSSCPIGFARCWKENTLASSRSWIYLVGKRILFLWAESAFDVCWEETFVSLFSPFLLVCPSPEGPSSVPGDSWYWPQPKESKDDSKGEKSPLFC